MVKHVPRKSAKYKVLGAEAWPVSDTAWLDYALGDPDNPEWVYSLQLAPDGTVVSLAIKPKAREKTTWYDVVCPHCGEVADQRPRATRYKVPPGGISTRMLARLRLGAMKRLVEERIHLMSVGEVPDHADWTIPDDLERWAKTRLGQTRHPGRPREVGLTTLLRAAKVYSEARDAPLKAVQAALNVSYSTARDRVRAARDEGLLPPTRRGMTNAKLTLKARQLLDELEPIPEEGMTDGKREAQR
jgi:hypothetical protein